VGRRDDLRTRQQELPEAVACELGVHQRQGRKEDYQEESREEGERVSSVFAVELKFLRHAYVATTAYGNPEEIVQPSRVFAGMVKACHANDQLHHRHVLERIEEAGAPEIHMSRAFTNPKLNTENRSTYYVPTRANKSDLAKNAPWGESKDGMSRPIVRFKEPRCLMIWPRLKFSDAEKTAADELLGEITHVGRVESLASLARVEEPGYEGLSRKFLPDPSGGNHSIRVPQPGVLKALEEAFDNGEHLDYWPTVAYSEGLSHEGTSSVWDKMVRLQLIGPPVHATRTLWLVEAVRSRLLSLEHDQFPLPPALTGHGGNKGSSHVAIVPLVFAGSDHADGLIKGLGICIPSSVTKAERAQIQGAILELCAQGFFLKRDDYELKLLDDKERTIVSRQERRWCKASRIWTSVTPVVLDVPPKKNRPVSTLVARACEHAGLPNPVNIGWRQTSYQGRSIPAARRFEVSRKGRKPMPGQVGHLRLEFEEPVRGPVVLGQLRHFGLGMMRPETDNA